MCWNWHFMNTHELYTLKWQILWYMNYISIKKSKSPGLLKIHICLHSRSINQNLWGRTQISEIFLSSLNHFNVQSGLGTRELSHIFICSLSDSCGPLQLMLSPLSIILPWFSPFISFSEIYPSFIDAFLEHASVH